MIPKNQIKLIRSLVLKKCRYQHQLFVVEGRKNVAELLSSNYKMDSLYATHDWIHENPNSNAIQVTSAELTRISNLKSPNDVLAVVKMKDNLRCSDQGLVLALDNISDPGNLGTIIRMSDWFGVSSIVCSTNTVDKYNPKVVQSSMGSIFRVPIHYTNLVDYLKDVRLPIYGACMDGKNVRNHNFTKDLHLVMGNEANGISQDVLALLSDKIKIKNIGNLTDSLNVAVATSILLHEICC